MQVELDMDLEMDLTSLQNQLRLDGGGARDRSSDGVDAQSAQV